MVRSATPFLPIGNLAFEFDRLYAIILPIGNLHIQHGGTPMTATPNGKTQQVAAASIKIRTSQELGEFVRKHRTSQKILQADIVGLANTGNRFVVDLEKGKPTLQLQKVLDVLDLLGLEVIVRRKGAR
jgi:y4mF family transcriptional regulator